MKKSIIVSIIALILVVGTVTAISLNSDELKDLIGEEGLGGVTVGNEYNATSTDGMSGIDDTGLIIGKPAALGSIVVLASSTAGTVTFWNATSTTDTASTTIFTVPTNMPENTYIFDLITPRGLSIRPSSDFNGNFVFTYR